MVKNNNKKGFTLVELLGVIVILLLLSTIVTPIFVNYIKKSRNDVYDNQINTIKQSAKNWASGKENIRYLPIKDGDCIEVTLERLKDNGYLDYNLKNPKTEQLFDDNMTVIIRKSGKDLVYEVNDEGNLTCDSDIVITSEYPKWVLTSSSPDTMSKSQTATVVLTSDRKIIAENLERKDITVKVGGKVIKDATVGIDCTNGDLLVCNLTIANLSGDGKLGLTIEKETMQDEDGNYSKRQGFITNTIVDGNGPKIVYVGRENTNSSSIYATKNDTVKIKFKVEKNNLTSNLTADDIAIYIDGNAVNCDKNLETDVKTSKIDFVLSLKSLDKNGKLSIKIPSNKIIDSVGNGNLEKIISPGITYDNVKPVITYNPNERAVYYSNIDVLILASDIGSGIKENTLKYIFSKNSDATPNIPILNKTVVSKTGERGSWYLITKVCDLAGNCEDKKVSGIYNLSDEGPSITITPNGNSGYAKSADVTINVESTGTTLNESTFKYTVAESVDASVDQIFENNETIHIRSLTGIYYVIAEACDEENNCTRKVSNQFSFDNEAPTIEYNPNGTNGYVKEQEVTLTVTDNTELDYTKYILSADKTALPLLSFNGSIELNLSAETLSVPSPSYIITTACDKLGNCKTLPSLPYYIDYESPKISVFVDGLDADIAISDDVALAGYKITNSTTTPTSWEPISGQTYSLNHSETEAATKYIHAIDSVGNTSYEIMEFVKQSCDVELDESWDFSYSNKPQPWTVPYTATYKLEVWGAQGGTCRNWRDNSGYAEAAGGKGGYSFGEVSLTAGQTIYIVTGGQPGIKNSGNGGNNNTVTAGYNGGGTSTGGNNGGGAGGGATHIGTFNSTLAEHGNTTGLFIVAGGGGGGGVYYGSTSSIGGTGGGTSGGSSVTTAYGSSTGGTESAGGTGNYGGTTGSFGLGANGDNSSGGSGGGGLYGGGGGKFGTGGGGGSGYVGGCISGTTGTSNGSQSGSGKAKITLTEMDGCDSGQTVWNYPYTSYEIPYIFKAPRDGSYKLEVWGAQSGDTTTIKGARGGYSVGTVELTKGDKLYIVVGGQGENSWAAYNCPSCGGVVLGGYNGGGNGRGNSDQTDNTAGGGGGGATHIASVAGTLKEIGASNIDKIYLVAGGGGAVIETVGSGHFVFCSSGFGGGQNGGNGTADSFGGTYNRTPGSGASQSSGYSFGQGGNYAGGGLYGGYSGNGSSWWQGNTIEEGGHAEGWCTGAGGGSGYIGGVTNGQTKSGNEAFTSPSGESETGHVGAGYARITYID